ncbi:MAG: hypothetical protein AAFR81_22315 [Chloroflexota bacterium]
MKLRKLNVYLHMIVWQLSLPAIIWLWAGGSNINSYYIFFSIFLGAFYGLPIAFCIGYLLRGRVSGSEYYMDALSVGMIEIRASELIVLFVIACIPLWVINGLAETIYGGTSLAFLIQSSLIIGGISVAGVYVYILRLRHWARRYLRLEAQDYNREKSKRKAKPKPKPKRHQLVDDTQSNEIVSDDVPSQTHQHKQ